MQKQGKKEENILGKFYFQKMNVNTMSQKTFKNKNTKNNY